MKRRRFPLRLAPERERAGTQSATSGSAPSSRPTPASASRRSGSSWKRWPVLNDFQLIDVVVDAGASAKSLDRPGWQRVMGAVHGRQVGAVLIAKLDRFTRSVADLATLIDTFSRRGVVLISAAESLDTSSAGGRLVVNVLGAVAQWEREATARTAGITPPSCR